jgi:O-antigen ligase
VLERLVTDRARLGRLLVACYVSALLPLAVGLYQAVSGRGMFRVAGVSRVRGTFVHPNSFAYYLVLLVVMGVALWPHVGSVARRPLGVLVVTGASMLVLTYSRGGWVAALAGLVIVGLLQSRRLIVGLVAACLVTVLAMPSVVGRIADLGEGPTARGTAGNSFAWRVEHWQATAGLAARNPVTGIGLKMTQYGRDRARAPHNDPLRMAVETGATGLLAYLGLAAALVAVARRALARTHVGIERGVAVGFAGCLAAFGLASMGANLLSQVVVAWYMAAFAAAALAVARQAVLAPSSLRS